MRRVFTPQGEVETDERLEHLTSFGSYGLEPSQFSRPVTSILVVSDAILASCAHARRALHPKWSRRAALRHRLAGSK